MTVFLTWPFKATGRPVAATLPDRLSRVINVKDDFNAKGDGSTEDSGAFQAAFDAAFGAYSASPDTAHGLNAQLNTPVYIPTGTYKISSAIRVRDAFGGHIYGDGDRSSLLQGQGGNSVLSFNGCRQMLFENFGIDAGGRASDGSIALQLDWDGSGSVGLRDVLIRHCGTRGGNYGCRIAQSNVPNAGQNITFDASELSGSQNNLSVEGDDCTVTVFSASAVTDTVGIWLQRGSLSSFGGQFAVWTDVIPGGGTDFRNDSTGTLLIAGGRSENKHIALATNGKTVILGASHTPGGNADSTAWSIQADSPAVVDIESCLFGSAPGVESAAACGLRGSGTFFVRNCSFHTGRPLHLDASFTGQIAQYLGSGIFTIAELPPAKEGLTLSVSNSNTGIWGATPTGSPDGTNKVMLRWNGTAWTVVG